MRWLPRLNAVCGRLWCSAQAWTPLRIAAHCVIACTFLKLIIQPRRSGNASLAQAAIQLPRSLTFAPIDFERETLAEGLAASGFDPTQQTFFTWLGVVPYLTEQAVWSTLGFIAGLADGAHVVFDYSDPPDSLPPASRAIHDRRAAHVAELGEAWVNYFESVKLHTSLMALGFSDIEDLGPPQIASRYFPNRLSSPPDKGGHVLRATTVSPTARLASM
jgi:O-methyltransferase involved in polyketide biosynthesis